MCPAILHNNIMHSVACSLASKKISGLDLLLCTHFWKGQATQQILVYWLGGDSLASLPSMVPTPVITLFLCSWFSFAKVSSHLCA